MKALFTIQILAFSMIMGAQAAQAASFKLKPLDRFPVIDENSYNIDITKLNAEGRRQVQHFNDATLDLRSRRPNWVASTGNAEVSVLTDRYVGGLQVGTINQLKVDRSTGQVVRAGFDTPDMPYKQNPTKIAIDSGDHGIWDSHGLATKLVREYDTPTGKVNYVQQLFPREVDGRVLRHQGMMWVINGPVTMQGWIADNAPATLKLSFSKNGQYSAQGHLVLPDTNEKIIGYHISSTGSRVTVHTASGNEYQYLVAPTGPEKEGGRALEFKLASEGKFDIKKYVVQSRTFAGRKTAAQPGDTARGMGVKAQE